MRPPACSRLSHRIIRTTARLTVRTDTARALAHSACLSHKALASACVPGGLRASLACHATPPAFEVSTERHPGVGR
jgi:hypothetical protein